MVRWLLACALVCPAATYEVGPGQPFASIGDVPLAALEPGDTVLIYWRPEPYREKFVLCRQGTAGAPITIRGVAGPEGELPVLDGEDAVTPSPLNYWRESRGVIKVGGANVPADTMPRHIVIEGLEIRGARPGNFFTDRFGVRRQYDANAAAIDVEKAEDLAVRNCVLTRNGNGLFIGSSESAVTSRVTVAGNYIHSNGTPGSAFEHNSYTEAAGIVFEYNRYGPLREGANGNNLKDRSAGLVVRYNWIEGGNRQLDLVDAGTRAIYESAEYRTAEVYGNVLIEPDGDGNRQIVHYGGDGGNLDRYRNGTLRFENNTVVSLRRDRTTLFRLSSNGERVEARNNIVYTADADGSSLGLADNTGEFWFERNWWKPGAREGFTAVEARISGLDTAITSGSPGFADEAAQDYSLSESSVCIDAGVPAGWPAFQYRKHRAIEPRPVAGPIDLGAFER